MVISGARKELAQMGDERKGRGQKKETRDGGAAEPQKEKPQRTKNKAALISNVIAKIEEKLTSEELKPSVGDFIRLLQLEKELEEEQPKEIEVSWVEPEEKEKESAPGE